MAPRTGRALVDSIYQAMNARDLDALDDLFAPDFLDHQDGGRGVEPLKEQLRSFVAAFSDLRIEVDDVVCEGDRLATRTTVTGTHDGELMGLAPTAARVSVSAVDLVRTEDGRAAERWGGLDMYSLLIQLGVIPQPQSA
ncbi:MAG TPA: ester cyclase [Acidimicrobiales bacterium]|nr:ester cyclase [Acidimicrobiales bacterium]